MLLTPCAVFLPPVIKTFSSSHFAIQGLWNSLFILTDSHLFLFLQLIISKVWDSKDLKANNISPTATISNSYLGIFMLGNGSHMFLTVNRTHLFVRPLDTTPPQVITPFGVTTLAWKCNLQSNDWIRHVLLLLMLLNSTLERVSPEKSFIPPM